MGKIADTILAQGTIKKFIPHVMGFDMTCALIELSDPKTVTVIVPKAFHGFIEADGRKLLTPQSVLSEKFGGFTTDLVLCLHWSSYCGKGTRPHYGAIMHVLLEVKR